MKRLGVAALVLVALAAGGLYWLRGNLDGLVKAAIEKIGSQMVQAPVTVDAVDIRPSDGRGVIRGLSIGNPAGFKSRNAMKVAEIDVAIDVRSLTGDVVTVTRIVIASPAVTYEKAGGMTNFDAIQKNIAAYAGPSKSQEPGKKLIVGEFAMRGATAQASADFMPGKTVVVALPDILLRDVGKNKGGVTPGELGQTIAAAVKQRLTGAVSFDRLARSMTQGVEGAGHAIKGLFGK